MKTFLLCFVLLFGGVFAFSSHAAGEIKLQVKNDDVTEKPKKEPPKKGPTPPKTVDEKRQLIITLTNLSKNEFKALKVVAVYFSRSESSPGIGIEKSQELTADLAPLGKAEVKSEVVTISYTPAGYSGGKRVKARGGKFAGCGVQVYDGQTLMAEFFSQQTLKTALSGAAQ